ncbi:MAG: prephenate dehydrogenase/arogenate dehydrogenase family protein [Acidobacteria bacterium]|nr:prephenate dehydrogenase/arogenate dehydrogenase family protein [Acidobacteriota bacterium]
MGPAEPFFKRISIIGLGLIGGSWALALKNLGHPAHRVGYDRPEVLSQALASEAVNEAAKDLPSAVRNADLVILATPVGAILDMLGQLQQHLSPRALVTDVGSTKRLICQRAKELISGKAVFLGGHPLAGKENSGFTHADATIFENVCYALTPSSGEHMNDGRAKAFVRLLESLGARPYVTDAASHDLAVAYLSHLPQLLSSGLASMVADELTEKRLPLELAGTGFRDLTRLADSPYGLWRDICLTNIENIQSGIEAMIQKLESIKTHLSDRELERTFAEARKLRDRLREQS